jgi:hypothetical protein
MLQFLVSIFLLGGISEGAGEGGFELHPQRFVTSGRRAYFLFQLFELLVHPVVDLRSPNERKSCGDVHVQLLHHICEGVHDFIDLKITHKGVREGVFTREDHWCSPLKGDWFRG